MAADPNESGGAFPALTSIRFIAAFAVVISHYAENGLLPLPSAIFDFVDGGRSAVSLFFVLSGFILTFTYRDKLIHGGARSFYEARVARIYPMILLGLLLCVPVVGYLLYTGDAALMLKWYALKEPVYLALAVSLFCQLLLLNGWVPFSSLNQPWNGPSDSVSCEAFFYTLFPFLLRRLVALKTWRLLLACAATWLVTGVWIAFLHRYVPVSRSGAMTYSMPITRLAEFVMGIAAGVGYLRLRANGRSWHAAGTVLAGVASIALVTLSVWRPLAPSFFLDAPWFAALILGLALMERPVLGILSWRPLVRLGHASYSLYLTHLPIALLALTLGFGQSNGWIVIVFCVVVSLVCFKLYEEPMRRRVRTHFVKQSARRAASRSGIGSGGGSGPNLPLPESHVLSDGASLAGPD
ncbi:acyltransferase family protein [Paraburkholderia susongensis]|uniref:Peptidoglycan/LPS O-acetylase OafA/YrhL, contains acyltransferase and SGNH-hydrolase domains n=1 Tax=Paraburkholderia susongensis TaxID=1515439 RepID=A0A1X7LXX3_9BURK|nr:acyltransferase [Paraburkholderia susongensis]SMG57969.1 Peptidoglycan/LPS O-acetylase OafA/YrhL, contains acyltransferase and SGNH-hydrolase domains [Paraburkholderia susongensis]